MIDERRTHKLEDLERITSIIRDFQFFVHEKYKIASDRPGSSNTKNVGSVTEINNLLSCTGPFALLGEEVFDDYWKYYLTKDMARAVGGGEPPYTDLQSYQEY